jgi:release factor glutamine methyltransferase
VTGVDADGATGAGGTVAAGASGPATPGDGEAPTWRELVSAARERLGAAGIGNAGQEARWIAEQAGGFEPVELVLALDRPVTERCGTHLHRMLERRLAGEPLQYVLGRWGFRSLDLYVDRRVLIPRPETEALAGAALAECERLDARLAVDLGTGSGAVALALAVERVALEVWATDASVEALAVARANLAGLGRAATRVRLVEGSWFAALPPELRGRIDVVVSNPPYVRAGEMDELPDEVRGWEPEMALASGPEGLDDIAVILAEAPRWLSRPGALLLEIDPRQAGPVQRLARDAGFSSATVWPDLTGRDRIVQARL